MDADVNGDLLSVSARDFYSVKRYQQRSLLLQRILPKILKFEVMQDKCVFQK